MCNKILFDYVGQGKENKPWGTIRRAGGGDGLAGTSEGFSSPGSRSALSGGAFVLNYKPELNVVGGRFWFFFSLQGGTLERDTTSNVISQALFRPGRFRGVWRLLGGLAWL